MKISRQKLTRGVLAERSGVNAETIRYYEKISLMPDPGRNQGGHRIYKGTHLQRLCFIRRCREMGFTLQEIRELLAIVDKEEVSCERVQGIAEAQLVTIQEKIDDLTRMKQTLRELSNQCSGEDVPDCPIIEVLYQS